MSVEDSLRADAWALQRIADYQSGKVLLWSWVSRGLLSMEHVAEWYYENDIRAAKDALSGTPQQMSKLCRVDELPYVDCSSQQQELQIAEETHLKGETVCVWAIQDLDNPESKALPLPGWFRAPIDKAILLWQEEARRWDKKLADRMLQGKDSLPPVQQKAFEEWSNSSTRPLVLDKKRRAQVVNIASKSIASLKKTCVLLTIHMSREASELRIKAGSGKLWRLQLLQCRVSPDDSVPIQIDDFQEGPTVVYTHCIFKTSFHNALQSMSIQY